MIKKTLASLMASLAIISTISTCTLAASAKSLNNSFRDKDVVNFATFTYGDVSRLRLGAGFTGITSTVSKYDTSYKRADYYEYTESAGVYTQSYHNYGTGTDDVVISNNKKTVPPSVARRKHTGYICLTSLSNSSKKDTYSHYVYKD